MGGGPPINITAFNILYVFFFISVLIQVEILVEQFLQWIDSVNRNNNNNNNNYCDIHNSAKYLSKTAEYTVHVHYIRVYTIHVYKNLWPLYIYLYSFYMQSFIIVCELHRIENKKLSMKV